MMDVWDPLAERIDRAAPCRWCSACSFVLLVLLSAGGWCLGLWLALLLWSVT